MLNMTAIPKQCKHCHPGRSEDDAGIVILSEAKELKQKHKEMFRDAQHDSYSKTMQALPS